MKIALIVIAMICCVACVRAWAGDGHAAGLGDSPPADRMTGTDGKSYSLLDYKGKSWVVVSWFPKAMTKG